jgi:hypothetical protein
MDPIPLGWWLARTIGMLAYLSLWLSTFFGVLVGARGAGGLLSAGTVFELHRAWSLVAVLTTLLHVAVVVIDPPGNVALFEALLAYGTTGGVRLGTVALWAMGAVAVSTAIKNRLSLWVWRAVHASAFGAFLVAWTHAFTAGTDTADPLVRALYIGTAATLAAAVAQRVLLATLSTPRG